MIFTTLHAQDQLGSREIKFSERAAAIEFRAMLVKNDSMIKPTMQMIISEALVRQDDASPTHYDFDPDSLFIVSKKLLDNMLNGTKAPVSLKFKITAFNALNQFFWKQRFLCL